MCSFHFGIPLWRLHRDVNQPALPSFQNNSKVRLLVSGFNLNNLSYPRHFVQLTILFSLSPPFLPPRSLAFPIAPKSITRKMETSASAWICGEKESESQSSLASRTSARSALDALPRITAVACPVGVISSPEDILANIRSHVRR